MKRYKANIKHHFEEAEWSLSNGSKFTRTSIELIEHSEGELVKYEDVACKWVTLDWNDRATIPAEMHKVWVVSDKIPYDAEMICQRDGGFYPLDREYPLDEAEEAGLKWCYLIKPEKI